jgi:hypothetical protein
LKHYIPYPLLIFTLWSCHALKVEEEIHLYGRSMTYYGDSAGKRHSVYVFSHLPCDSLKLKGKDGHALPRKIEKPDTNCYYCEELESEKNIVIMNSVRYKNKEFQFAVYFPDGNISLSNETCTKFEYGLFNRLKWGDSLSVVMWHKLDQENGLLIFYLAEETNTFPYYKPENMDSFKYSLNEICSGNEMEELKKALQKMYEQKMNVQVTPNPFTEKFDLIIVDELVPWLLPEGTITLTFFDEKGNTLLAQPIELDKTYTFSFPDIASGKHIYYRITWEEYVIAGQVLKN